MTPEPTDLAGPMTLLKLLEVSAEAFDLLAKQSEASVVDGRLTPDLWGRFKGAAAQARAAATRLAEEWERWPAGALVRSALLRINAGPIEPPVTHWRRQEDEAVIDDGTWAGHTVVASACGHIVPHGDTISDPTKADCPECRRIHALDVVTEAQALAAARVFTEAFKKA